MEDEEFKKKKKKRKKGLERERKLEKGERLEEAETDGGGRTKKKREIEREIRPEYKAGDQTGR